MSLGGTGLTSYNSCRNSKQQDDVADLIKQMSQRDIEFVNVKADKSLWLAKNQIRSLSTLEDSYEVKRDGLFKPTKLKSFNFPQINIEIVKEQSSNRKFEKKIVKQGFTPIIREVKRHSTKRVSSFNLQAGQPIQLIVGKPPLNIKFPNSQLPKVSTPERFSLMQLSYQDKKRVDNYLLDFIGSKSRIRENSKSPNFLEPQVKEYSAYISHNSPKMKVKKYQTKLEHVEILVKPIPIRPILSQRKDPLLHHFLPQIELKKSALVKPARDQYMNILDNDMAIMGTLEKVQLKQKREAKIIQVDSTSTL